MFIDFVAKDCQATIFFAFWSVYFNNVGNHNGDYDKENDNDGIIYVGTTYNMF